MLLSGLSLFFIICAIEEVNENGKTCTCTKCTMYHVSNVHVYISIFGPKGGCREETVRLQSGSTAKNGKNSFLQICGILCFQMVDFEMNSGGGGGGVDSYVTSFPEPMR